jgi:hypothetical protein
MAKDYEKNEPGKPEKGGQKEPGREPSTPREGQGGRPAESSPAEGPLQGSSPKPKPSTDEPEEE